MIDLSLQIPAIEKLIKLMKKHNVHELSADWINLKITPEVKKPRKRRASKKETAKVQEEQDQEFLDNHTIPPLDPEPWNNIDQTVIDRFAINGKIGG